MHDVRSDRPYEPAPQVVQLVLELVSCLPAAQAMHELEPVELEYWPTAQAIHELEPAELE